MKPFSVFFLILTLVFCLCACSQEAAAPETTEPETTVPETTADPRVGVEELSMVVDELSILELEEYPDLKRVDLSGSTCYTAIVVYSQNHPQVEVRYTIDFGGEAADHWSEEIVLDDVGVDYELLMRNLIFLPNLRTVRLPQTRLTHDQISALRMQYPNVEFTYSVLVLGRETDGAVTELNLSELNPAAVQEVIPSLLQLDHLESVELMSAAGTSSLSKQDVKTLVDALPGVKFHYVFSLFGQTISTTDEKVTYKGLSLGESDIPELRAALSIMSGCEAFVLDDCGLSNETMAEIRADYPNTELVWKVYFGKDNRYPYYTNATAIRAVYNVTDDTCYNIRYCTGVKYIDMGHNDYLTDASFVGYLPNLEILILSGSAITDLSGFENCQKLEFLELANCLKLSDLTPLAGCSNLKYLNICYTKVSSLMPLDGLPLELLFCKQTRVSAEEQKVFKEVHEDCLATFTGRDPYAGPGWRYVDNGRTFTEIYKKVRQVFNLDAADKLIAAGAK